MSEPRLSGRALAEAVTQNLVQRIEAGALPWSRPWSLTGEGGRPLRHDGCPYNGINCLLLWSTAESRGYRSRYWMTARQAECLGGALLPGAAASFSIYAATVRQGGTKATTTEAGHARIISFLRHYTVFNADEIVGLPDWYYVRDVPPLPRLLSERQAAIDAFFAKLPVQIRRGGDEAFYCPLRDIIQMPHLGSFHSADAYASTLAHECVHWTGSPQRLNREFPKRFGDDAYAFEELVACIGEAMICAELGLPSQLQASHAGYLAHWLSILRTDTSAIFLAAKKAEQAIRYLHDCAANAATSPLNTAIAA